MFSVQDTQRLLNTGNSAALFPITRAFNELEKKGIRPGILPALPDNLSRANFVLRTINGDSLEIASTHQPCQAQWQSNMIEGCLNVLKTISGKKLNAVLPPDRAKVEFNIPNFEFDA